MTTELRTGALPAAPSRWRERADADIAVLHRHSDGWAQLSVAGRLEHLQALATNT
ncbi:MAG: hypothetical protein H0X35_09340, partial [Pseudonocardiales bacterium]|nr:hypothetical protein [Pseudonocardiales bacterium]